MVTYEQDDGSGICKKCKGHYNPSREYRYKYADCKNVFVDEDGHSLGQCVCYHPSHGISERFTGYSAKELKEAMEKALSTDDEIPF